LAYGEEDCLAQSLAKKEQGKGDGGFGFRGDVLDCNEGLHSDVIIDIHMLKLVSLPPEYLGPVQLRSESGIQSMFLLVSMMREEIATRFQVIITPHYRY
jgi:hypothetical protein